MHLLAIETSTQLCGVALTENSSLVAEYRVNIKNIHAAQLFPIIHSLMESAAFDQKNLDAVAVSIGPGSFTGLRIGLSAAKGIALGHDLPLIAVPTLQALAHNAPVSDGLICTLLQSRANEYYIAQYSRERYKDALIKDIEIQSFDELVETLPKDCFLIGHTQKFKEQEKIASRCHFVPEYWTHLSALSVAAVGSKKYQLGEFEDIRSLEPMYHQQFIAGKPKKLTI